MNNDDYEKFEQKMLARLLENKNAETTTLYLNIFALYASCFMLNMYKAGNTEAILSVEVLIEAWKKSLEDRIGIELDNHSKIINDPDVTDDFKKKFLSNTEAHQQFDDALYKAEQIIRDVLQMKKEDGT